MGRRLRRNTSAGDATNAQALVISKKGGEVSTANQIRIVKHGRGALYVSSALEYFTADENVPAQSSQSLKITREYLRLRVTENEGGKSSWKVEPFIGRTPLWRFDRGATAPDRRARTIRNDRGSNSRGCRTGGNPLAASI